jgi:hypothetical protein
VALGVARGVARGVALGVARGVARFVTRAAAAFDVLFAAAVDGFFGVTFFSAILLTSFVSAASSTIGRDSAADHATWDGTRYVPAVTPTSVTSITGSW